MLGIEEQIIFSVDLYMHKIYNNMYCYISEVSHLIAIINSVMASICRQARINPFQLQIICRLLETKVERASQVISKVNFVLDNRPDGK